MMGKSVEQRLGNYYLTRLIGRGGFAEVYYGEHIYLKTPAAIKVLTMQITQDEREKFLTEARIAANLTHSHIVTVLEFGVEHDTPYLVMDYAAHGTLRQHYPRGTTLVAEQIVSYVQQAASALQYTHEQHLIHRDLKPENMLLDGNDTLLLSDFGIAQLVQSTQSPTNEPHIVGTVAYMAPEQLRGEASTASDQYALAAVIYEWLCGAPPFRGSFAEVALQHTFVVPQPLQERLPSLSKSIAEVVAIGLAKDPYARFKSIESFARAFAQACAMKPEIGNISPYSLAKPALTLIKEPSFLPLQEEKQSAKPLARRKVVVGLLAGIGLAGAATGLAWKPLSQLLTKKAPPAKPIHSARVVPGTTLYTFHGHPSVQGVAWMHDSQHIISAGDNIQIWEAMTGKIKTVYREGSPGSLYINVLSLSVNGKYLAFAATISQLDSTFISKIEVIEIETIKSINVLHQLTNDQTIVNGQARAMAWSPDNTLLASADGGTNGVQIWDVSTGKLLITYQGHQNPVHALSWSPDGGLIASADGDPNLTTVSGTVHLWEPATGQIHMIYREHTSTVNTVAWSPNGKLLASGSGIPTYGSSSARPSDNTVRVWGPESKHAQLTYSGHTAPVMTVAWSPNGKFVASGSRDKVANVAPIQVWDASSGQTILRFQGQGNTSYNNGSLALAWSPDAKLLASAQSDSSVQIWKAI